MSARIQTSQDKSKQAASLVSVIIPVHDRPHCIAGAVSSVLSQEGVKLELIVVDDGSRLPVREVLKDIADSRLCILQQDNKGVSAARNAGIAVSSGEIIALLDSDDEFLPGKLKKQAAYLRENGLEICQTEEIWIRNGTRVNPMHKHAKPSGNFFDRAVDMCLVSPSCVMFTRRFVEVVGLFDESLPACEDYDLWLRALTRFEVGLLPEVLTVKYGGHADQLSRRIIGLDLFRIKALVKLLQTAELSGEQRRQAEAALTEKTRIYVQGCAKRGRLDEARRVQLLCKETLQRSAQACRKAIPRRLRSSSPLRI